MIWIRSFLALDRIQKVYRDSFAIGLMRLWLFVEEASSQCNRLVQASSILGWIW